MTVKKKKNSYGIIINCDEASVLDTPEDGSPLVCQLKAGDKVQILSKPNKNFFGVGISNSVIGFVSKKHIKAE